MTRDISIRRVFQYNLTEEEMNLLTLLLCKLAYTTGNLSIAKIDLNVKMHSFKIS